MADPGGLDGEGLAHRAHAEDDQVHVLVAVLRHALAVERGEDGLTHFPEHQEVLRNDLVVDEGVEFDAVLDAFGDVGPLESGDGRGVAEHGRATEAAAAARTGVGQEAEAGDIGRINVLADGVVEDEDGFGMLRAQGGDFRGRGAVAAVAADTAALALGQLGEQVLAERFHRRFGQDGDDGSLVLEDARHQTGGGTVVTDDEGVAGEAVADQPLFGTAGAAAEDIGQRGNQQAAHQDGTDDARDIDKGTVGGAGVEQGAGIEPVHHRPERGVAVLRYGGVAAPERNGQDEADQPQEQEYTDDQKYIEDNLSPYAAGKGAIDKNGRTEDAFGPFHCRFDYFTLAKLKKKHEFCQKGRKNAATEHPPAESHPAEAGRIQDRR